VTLPGSQHDAPVLRSMAVVGAGLIGTSVALAARSAGITVELYDSSAAHVSRACDLGAGTAGAVPWTAGDAPAQGQQRADLVVLATPPETLAANLLRAQQRGLGRTYTDVGSVKVRPLREARRLGCDLGSFVGGHPMAGRERSGPGAAQADLFVGRPWVLTPVAVEPPEMPAHLARVRALVVVCGALPVVLDAQAHDEAVALVSHVPHVVSALLAGRLVDAADPAVGLVGQGVRDVTRIAGSDPALWTGILTANAQPVARVLRALRSDLDAVLAALDAVPEQHGTPPRADALTQLLAAGVAGRARIPGKHGAPPTTYAVVPVVVADRPGELARLLVDAGAAGINVEDVSIEHSPGQPAGSVELAVRPEAMEPLTAALRERGWTVHR
jgi:prephenate dehydrogenase